MKPLVILLLSIALLALGRTMPVAAAVQGLSMASCDDMRTGQPMVMDASCERCCLTPASRSPDTAARLRSREVFSVERWLAPVAWTRAPELPPPRR